MKVVLAFLDFVILALLYFFLNNINVFFFNNIFFVTLLLRVMRDIIKITINNSFLSLSSSSFFSLSSIVISIILDFFILDFFRSQRFLDILSILIIDRFFNFFFLVTTNFLIILL